MKIKVECCKKGRPSGDFLLYIDCMSNEKVSKTSEEDKYLLSEIYKHLKSCEKYGSYYTAFKTAFLGRYYKDYVNDKYVKKFGFKKTINQ